MKLSVNTGFLVNRYPSPSQWASVIDKLNVRYVQLTSDLFSPYYDKKILDQYVDQINELKDKYDFSINSVFTGGFTRVNHFCHPDELVREYWMNWFKKFINYADLLGAKRLGSHIGILSIPDNQNQRKVFQDRCITLWKILSEYAEGTSIKELTWEHMSIEREQGHVQKDIDYIIESFMETKIPVRLCLDPDHGDLSSGDSGDYEPYGLLEKYLPFSSQLHLKQTSKDKRKNSTFTDKNNESGLIVGDKVANLLKKYVSDDRKDDFELILELNAREREPDDSLICKEVEESLNYWRKVLEKNNIKYE